MSKMKSTVYLCLFVVVLSQSVGSNPIGCVDGICDPVETKVITTKQSDTGTTPTTATSGETTTLQSSTDLSTTVSPEYTDPPAVVCPPFDDPFDEESYIEYLRKLFAKTTNVPTLPTEPNKPTNPKV
jgi:hypothetical protein